MSNQTVLCALCPLCGGKPSRNLLITWPGQGWCDNPACSVLCWNPCKTLDENLLEARAHNLPDWLGGG